jgi:N-acetylglucosamine malate deacetylase 2
MKKILSSVLFILLLSTQAISAVPKGDLLDGIQPGSDGKIDILAIFAHQDDESIYGGGALLKAKNDPRVRVHFLCMTLGDMSSAKKKLGITSEQLGKIRTEELKTAASVYDAENVFQLRYHDQGLSTADREALIITVVDHIESTGAELVITHDPGGITGHPDHVTTSSVVQTAFNKTTAQKLIYTTFPKYLYVFPYQMGDKEANFKPEKPDFKVDIKNERKLKKMVMYSHTSQKHFSGVGPLMDIVSTFSHEWFIVGGSHEIE